MLLSRLRPDWPSEAPGSGAAISRGVQGAVLEPGGPEVPGPSAEGTAGTIWVFVTGREKQVGVSLESLRLLSNCGFQALAPSNRNGLQDHLRVGPGPSLGAQGMPRSTRVPAPPGASTWLQG